MYFGKFFEGFSSYPDELVVHASSDNSHIQIVEHDSFENMNQIVKTYWFYKVIDFTFSVKTERLTVYLEGGSDVK